jgi:serine phosphatase RsbU (regulator of sigma subunit)
MAQNSNLLDGYYSIIRITYSFVSLCTLGLAAFQFHNRMEFEKNQISRQIEQATANLELVLSGCSQHVLAMQSQAEDYLNIVENQSVEPLFSYLKYEKSEQFFHLDSLPKVFPKEQTANISGTFDFSKADAAKVKEMNMAISLNPIFKAAKNNVPNLAWVYYTANDFISIYPWVSSQKFKFTLNLHEHEFYKHALPDANPLEEMFWTPVYVDEAGKGLMVTCSAPVYENKDFKGSVSLDITVDSLNRIISSSQLPYGKVFLVNDHRQLMAHPDLVKSTDKSIKNINEALPEEVKSALKDLDKYEQKELILESGYFFYISHLPNTKWKILCLVSRNDLYKEVILNIGGILLFVTFSIVILLISSNAIVKREFIRPAQNLILHIRHENENKPTLRPAKLPQAWLAWFDLISKIFQSQRDLTERLELQNKDLEIQVELRTKELHDKALELESKNSQLQQSELEIRKNAEKLQLFNQHLSNTNAKLLQREEELKEQHTRLHDAYEKIHRHNQNMTSSVTYAQRIQRAIFGDVSLIENHFEGAFLIFKPRDIVSGDFFWISGDENHAVLISGDCTGHGIPGAFMTVLGFTLLNEIIVGKKIFSPDLILKETDKKIIEITQRDVSGGKINDGMEMSVLVFHKHTNIVEVASAGTPVYYRTDEGLHVIAPNKAGLGDTHPKLDKAFRKNIFHVKKGENFYLTTDGFQDQSGGEQNRRFTKTRLRELLWSVRDLPISEQKLVIRQSFQQWRKEQAQTDDVLLIGIKI